MKRRLLLTLTSVLISLGVAAVLGEVYFRLTTSYMAVQTFKVLGMSIPTDINPYMLTRWTSDGLRLNPNSRVTLYNHWTSGQTVTVTTDSRGFRGSEIPGVKGPSEIRILVLGDSTTLEDYLPDDVIYTTLLESLIEKSVPGKKITVINAGVVDIGTKEEIDILERQGLDINPDIVLVSFFLNDSRPPWGFSGEVEYRNWLRRNSVLADTIWRNLTIRKWTSAQGVDRMRWTYTKPGWSWPADHESFLKFATADAKYDWGAAWDPNSWQPVGKQLARLAALSKTHGFKVAIAAFPVTYQFRDNIYDDTPQKQLATISRQYGFGFTDLLPIIDKEDSQTNLYFDHCHPNEAGNRVIAQALTPFITEMIQQEPPKKSP